MVNSGVARAFRAALLGASMLVASPALAQAQAQSVEERLERLEKMVEGLITRLDAEAGAKAEQAEALAAVRAETGAIRAEQQAMRGEVDPRHEAGGNVGQADRLRDCPGRGLPDGQDPRHLWRLCQA